MRVTTRHLFTIPGYSRRRGFCRDKSRAWAKRHGLDWREFVRNGIDAAELEKTGDAFALALVRTATRFSRSRRENFFMAGSLSRIGPHRQTGLRHIGLGLAHRMLAEMEDRCCQHRGGMAVADAGNHVVEIADAA